jgi:protein-tyrosine phosphatase
VQRVIALEGGRNFRDLGGYPAGEKKRVRWRRLYRSGTLSNVTAAGHAELRARGIRVLCDFRTQREREREVADWSGEGRTLLAWDYDPKLVSVRALLSSAGVSHSGLTSAVARCAMLELYRRLPTRLAEPYAALFARLADGDLPLIFGCAAGKDRTGVAAALILSALDVSREVIVSDYTLTNQLVDLEQVLFRDPRRSIGLEDEHGQLAQVDRSTRAPFLEASPEYLAATFEQIESDHGSVDAYLRTQLGVGPPQLASIREHLLEDL